MGTSLDGFIARPDGGIDWLGDPDDPGDEDFGWSEFFPTIDRMVMGRATFEKLLTFDAWMYGDTPLTVMTSTLQEVPERVAGKVTLSRKTPAEVLDELGTLGCKRVYVDGGRLVQSFLREDLIDELVISRLPILIGQGIPLFGPLPGDLRWTHRSTKVFDSHGIIKSTYSRRRGASSSA